MITPIKTISFSLFASIFCVAPLLGHGTHVSLHAPSDVGLVRMLTKDEKQHIYQSVKAYDTPKHFTPLFTKDDHAWKELDMDLLIETLDRTTSGVGAEEFRRLMQPITNINELEKRAAILRELDENPELFDRLDQTVRILSSLEDHLLHPFDIHASPLEAFFGKGYMESTCEVLADAMRWSGVTPGENLFTNLAIMFKENFTFKFSLGMQFASAILTALTLNNERDHIKGDFFSFKDSTKKVYARILKAGYVVTNSLLLGASGIGLVQGMYQTLKVIPAVDENVLATAKAFSYLDSLSHLLDQTKALSHNSSIKKLIWFFDKKLPKPREVEHLMVALGTRLLAEMRYGVLAAAQQKAILIDSAYAYDALQKTKFYFFQLFQALGTIDAYLSIIRLKKEYEQAGIPTTFADFNHDNALTLKNIHNPLIKHSASVANSFSFGTEATRDAIFTGPHGCGKTTGMKSIVGAYILGQSIIIIPAEYASFMPITALATYFNITDNLAEGVSSFMAEEQRMQELQALLDSINPKEIILIAVDEPYAKTIQQIGEDKVYLFAKRFAQNHNKNMRLLLATHFELPSVLEHETHGLVKNLQPELIEKESGSFEPTFRIIEGSADWWFNDKSKRDRFITWLGRKISIDKAPHKTIHLHHDHSYFVHA